MKCLSLIICLIIVCPPLPDDWVSSFVEEIIFLPEGNKGLYEYSPSEKNIANRAWKTRPTIKMCTGNSFKKHYYMNRFQKYFFEIPALNTGLQTIPVKILFGCLAHVCLVVGRVFHVHLAMWRNFLRDELV